MFDLLKRALGVPQTKFAIVRPGCGMFFIKKKNKIQHLFHLITPSKTNNNKPVSSLVLLLCKNDSHLAEVGPVLTATQLSAITPTPRCHDMFVSVKSVSRLGPG